MEEDSLVTLIKKKKELSGLADQIIREKAREYISNNKINLISLSSKSLKIIVSEIRSELRNISGQYQKNTKERDILLKEGKIEELLNTHTSTSERIKFYPFLKEKIASLRIKSILDLGCGLNPLALASKNIKYYASDIKQDELNLIRLFFSKNKIKGKSFFYDIAKISNDLPSSELCIIFKVLDIVENRRELTEKILSTVHCRYFLISFSTKKLSGRPMNFPERKWFEKILSRNNLNFEKFSSDNEIFYLIYNSS